MEKAHQVVIVGGGFGGLYATKSLKNAPVRVTLIDRRNFHLFQPLLYQVATGALSPANIAAPLRAILKRQKNTNVLLAEVVDIDAVNRSVALSDGAKISYDSLIIAAGARHHYFGKDEWEKLAPGLKTIEDATKMRRRILLAFESAEREPDPEKVKAWLTFVIVGAGPTGLELAGALAEIAHDTLKYDFRSINPADARILLIEGAERVLPPYPADLSVKATEQLSRLSVTVRTSAIVAEIQPDSVTLRSGEKIEKIPTRTVLWAAGVQASPLGQILSKATGVTLDPAGRVMVEPNLTVPGRPEIFVLGDMVNFSHQTGKPLPGVAPVAMQQGRYVAHLIDARLRGQVQTVPFHYKDKGSMATIGRAAAVADIGGFHFSGLFAWLAWLFIHLMYLVEFENRQLVFLQWAWNYVTRNRAARLITGEDSLQR
ncbi:NAD(P)/FAD-dependent oxidoreductase [Candidatus Acetothermia bacterium]|nr:NAD(P)/FAD-dependent oxidoreductase [Candidatus Acetothermia bacterium]